jgi:hypothetical protein
MAEHQARAGTVAVMQPYFYPYAGYFRLIAAAETFIILDDVQFPRRGRVHRCALPGPAGKDTWLTLPLAPAPRDVQIRDICFSPGARAAFDVRLSRLNCLQEGQGPGANCVRAHLASPLNDIVDFLEAGLRLVSEILELPAKIVRASSLGVGLRGQDHIIALAEAVGGAIYVNAPGGRDLYSADAFAARGLTLKFLPPYDGAYSFLLPALVQEQPEAIRDDILKTTDLCD